MTTVISTLEKDYWGYRLYGHLGKDDKREIENYKLTNQDTGPYESIKVNLLRIMDAFWDHRDHYIEERVF